MKRSLLALVLVAWPIGAFATRPSLAAPPPPRAVISAAQQGLPAAPGWAQANYLEVPVAGSPPRTALRVSMGPGGMVREDLQDLGPLGRTTVRFWAPAAAGLHGALEIGEAPAWLQLLAGRPLDDILRAKGVDIQRTAYARDGVTLLWVLGAGPQEPDAPQLHVMPSSGWVRQFTERLGTGGGVLTVRLGPPIVTVDGADAVGSGVPAASSRPTEPPLAGALSGAGWPAHVTFVTEGRELTLALRHLVRGEPLDPLLFAQPPGAAASSSGPSRHIDGEGPAAFDP